MQVQRKKSRCDLYLVNTPYYETICTYCHSLGSRQLFNKIQGGRIPSYHIEERMKELGIPGVSIAIVTNGEIEWAKGYGIADSLENDR